MRVRSLSDSLAIHRYKVSEYPYKIHDHRALSPVACFLLVLQNRAIANVPDKDNLSARYDEQRFLLVGLCLLRLMLPVCWVIVVLFFNPRSTFVVPSTSFQSTPDGAAVDGCWMKQQNSAACRLRPPQKTTKAQSIHPAARAFPFLYCFTTETRTGSVRDP
jgi:hypothetical protein